MKRNTMTTMAYSHKMNQKQLNDFAMICTMATIKRLLSKQYTPYIDDLRNTWSQCKRADRFGTISDTIAFNTESREFVASELSELCEQLSDFDTSYSERILIEDVYSEKSMEYAELSETLATLKSIKSESYSDLKDLAQEFILAYMTANPTTADLLSVSNKVQYCDNGRSKRKELRHIARIKYGMRAVNKYIRKQSSGIADYNKELTSLEITLENGGKIKALTRNTYADDLGDLARIRNMAQRANLSANQSRWIERFASKEARAIEQQARSEYHAKMYDSMIARREKSLFDERISKVGYDARCKYAFECIGIETPQGQSKMMKRIIEKLKNEHDVYCLLAQ